MAWPEFDTVFGESGRVIDWTRSRFDPGLPLLDCGSGTGAGTVALAEAFPTSTILAVEPDAGMRTLLIHRIVSTPALADRVSVLPSTLEDARLEGPLGGVVATGFLYFLPPALRRWAWDWFAQHVVPGAGVVFEDGHAPNPSTDEPERLVQTRHVGRLRYERWFSQGPEAGGGVIFRNTVRVWDNDRLIIEDTSAWHSWPLTTAITTEECRATGAFSMEPLSPGYLIARR